MIAHILPIILFSRESLKTPKTKWSTKTYAKLYDEDFEGRVSYRIREQIKVQ